MGEMTVADLSFGAYSFCEWDPGPGSESPRLSNILVRNLSRHVLKSSRMIVSVRALKTKASFQ